MGLKQEAEGIVEIDEHHLDKECIELPTQYLAWAWRAAEAKRDVDEAKAKLDVTTSELAQKIRANPGAYGIEKLSETIISSTVPTLEGHKKVVLEFQQAKHRHELAQAVVWAIEHKKRSLTLLVELHGMGYFANVKVSEAGKDAVKKMTRRRSVRKED